MVTDTERLIYQMSVDIRRYEKAMDRAIARTNGAAGSIENRFKKMRFGVSSDAAQMANTVRAAIATIGVTYAIREIAQYSDAWTNLRNSTAQFVDIVGDADIVLNELTDIALDARVGLDALGQTFAASNRAARDLNLDNPRAQVLAFNEGVAKGAAIANTGVAATTGALRQLGQAISSPRVQLQEFNSVIEGTPRLAQAFADGIEGAEGSVARLRALIADGDVSGANLFEALLTQLPTLREEFRATESTISQSETNLETAFTRYVGTNEVVQSASSATAGFINLVANNLDLLTSAAVITAAALAGVAGVRGVQALIIGLQGITSASALAAAGMTRLRAAAAFLGGPLGIAVGLLAAALTAVALNGQKAVRSIEEIVASGRELQDGIRSTTLEIEDDTAKMRDLYEQIEESMRNQSDAAADTARAELVALAARRQGLQETLTTYRALAASNIAEAIEARDEINKELTNINLTLNPNVRGFLDWTSYLRKADRETIAARHAALNSGKSSDEANAIADRVKEQALIRYHGEFLKRVEEQRKALIERALAGESLSGSEKKLLTHGQRLRDANDAISEYRKNYEAIEVLTNQAQIAPKTGIGAVILSAVQGVEELQDVYRELDSDVAKYFKTERDEIDATLASRLDEINKTRAGEVAKEQARVLARAVAKKQIEALDAEESAARIKTIQDEARARQDAIDAQISAQETLERRRLDQELALAEAAGDQARVTALNRELDILREMDELRRIGFGSELEIAEEAYRIVGQRAQAEDAAAATALEKARNLQSIQDELEVARAKGDADRIAALERQLSLAERIATYLGLGYSDDVALGKAISQEDSVETAPETSRLRETFRQAFRSGVRQGIADDDWGSAAREVFASAITSAFEKSLDRIADLLFDAVSFAFQNANIGKIGGSVLAAAGSLLSFGGAAGATGATSAALSQSGARLAQNASTGLSPAISSVFAPVSQISIGANAGVSKAEVAALLDANNQVLFKQMPQLTAAGVIEGQKFRRF